MKYHNLTKDDMLNGDGIRVVLWVSGCSHHCKGCHNPETWNPNHGLDFTESVAEELYRELEKDYVSGITFSGGDPLHENNRETVKSLCQTIKKRFPDKNIWIYTGYEYDEIKGFTESFLGEGDVIVDGKYIKGLPKADWVGSNNQKVIRIKYED